MYCNITTAVTLRHPPPAGPVCSPHQSYRACLPHFCFYFLSLLYCFFCSQGTSSYDDEMKQFGTFGWC